MGIKPENSEFSFCVVATNDETFLSNHFENNVIIFKHHLKKHLI